MNQKTRQYVKEALDFLHEEIKQYPHYRKTLEKSVNLMCRNYEKVFPDLVEEYRIKKSDENEAKIQDNMLWRG